MQVVLVVVQQNSFNNEVMALDLQSKKLLWKYTPTDRQFPFYSSAAIAGGCVFVGSNDGRVYGLDLASGKKIWEYEAASPVTSRPGRRQGQGRRRRGRRPGHLLRITPNANS